MYLLLSVIQGVHRIVGNILGDSYMGQNKAKMKNNGFPKKPFFELAAIFKIKDIISHINFDFI